MRARKTLVQQRAQAINRVQKVLETANIKLSSVATDVLGVSGRDMIEAIKSVDGPDIEAIVQFGANLPMARLADEAERWLDKPVISVNVATYWHACRMNGIGDKLYGFTQLFSRF